MVKTSALNMHHIEQRFFLLLKWSCWAPVKKIITISENLKKDGVRMKVQSVNNIVIIQPFKFCQAYSYFFIIDKYL